jgi:hypothetical protein
MGAIRLSNLSKPALLALCLGAIPLQGIASGQSVRDAVIYEESVVCLNGEGRFLAWDTASGDFKPELSAELSKARLDRIASNGKRIWGVREKNLLEWSPGTKSWKAVTGFEAGGEKLASIAVVGDTPLLIYPTKVLSPISDRVFGVPQLQGQFNNLKELRVLAVQPMDRVLWIGTGYGEWGGHLVGLDVQKGRWVQFHDALHYVTGIARGPKDEPIVSWSMSHFSANTLIRVHKPDATPEISYPELQDKYYQKVAYSPFDKKLYGLEQQTIVSIAEGKPSTVARLEVQVFEREPRAIGVAPGILAFFPVAPETLVVVPNRSAPLMIKAGKPIPLRVP